MGIFETGAAAGERSPRAAAAGCQEMIRAFIISASLMLFAANGFAQSPAPAPAVPTSCRGGPAGAQSLGKLVAATATTAAKPPGRVEQSVTRTAAGAGQGQPALAVDDAAGALERAAALYPMARHAAGTASTAASALPAIQEPAAGAAAAGARVFQSFPADAAGTAFGVAQAVAPDDPGAAPQCDTARPHARATTRSGAPSGSRAAAGTTQCALNLKTRPAVPKTPVFKGDSCARRGRGHPRG